MGSKVISSNASGIHQVSGAVVKTVKVEQVNRCQVAAVVVVALVAMMLLLKR